MIKRVIQYMETIKKAMAKVSTEIRRCEPTEYIRSMFILLIFPSHNEQYSFLNNIPILYIYKLT